MNLETPLISVQKSAKDLYEFLIDFKNFERIMPQNTDKFEIKDDGFIFALKGMPTIKLKLDEKIPHSKIVLGSAAEKFPFTLTAIIVEDDTKSKVNFSFEGKFNPMISMMVKKPLQKFIDTLSENLENLEKLT
ncbi:MAG: SRPBCC family protein [Flavobacteriaceae bacterium]